MMLKPVFSHFTMKKGILPFLQEFPWRGWGFGGLGYLNYEWIGRLWKLGNWGIAGLWIAGLVVS